MAVIQKQPSDAQVEELVNKNIILSSVDYIFNFARAHSFWPVTFGLACCAIEMMAAGGARYDISRFGYEVFRPSPRQADVMIVAGTITKKMQPLVQRIYDQMAEPKWVIAMGSCAISGGPFAGGYNVVDGADTFLPVDVYIPGCPPRPEALIDGLLELRKRVINPNVARVK
ncbi:MAG: NADH-quinone oxidoreductase subunit [Clostridia bacterium]|jgi:NADH-quinone oxidoreductase subunit B|nr:dehydrogenase subunit [Clostridiales bacterium]MDK2984724.1 NADH-quinone oxidoreductase subunit [Clostridia bacterium]